MKKDLIGEQFNQWTVIQKTGSILVTKDRKESTYLCTCSCGVKRIIRRSYLTSNRTKSCGCHLKPYLLEKAKNKYVNKVYNNLLILDLKTTIKAVIKCHCGKIKTVSLDHVINGKIKSCGCVVGKWAKENLSKYKIGDKFGHWTLIKRLKNSSLKCKCICGTIKIAHISNFSRFSRSCGCKKKELTKEKSLEKYGTESPASSILTKNNSKKKMIEKYGVTSYLKTKEGKAKIKQTMLNRYGVEHCSQNKEIALRAARKVNKPSIKFHWLTNEELICQGSWETKVVDYLNVNQINYKWQPETFKLSTGKTYRPDLYLIDTDTWVEIKGWMRPDAKLKWDEFQIIKPNSELWDKVKLKEMRIL